MDVSAGHSGSLQSSSGGDDLDDDTHEFHSPPGPGPGPSPSPSDPLISSFFQFNSSELLMTTHLQPHPPPLSRMSHMTHMNMNDSLSHSHFSFSQLPIPPAAAPAPTPTPTPTPTASNPSPSPPTSSSRKRTRASRRAPTTVLTTDTSNFRAMVQEFTGIPAPPFAPSPSLFSSPSHHLQPPYLLRPFAHKLNTSSTSNSPAPLQTPCTSHDQAHGGGGQTSTLLNMPINSSQSQSQSQSQLLSFQSLLHDQSQQLIQPKYTPAAAAHALLGSSDKLHQGGWPGTGSGSVSAPADGADMPESIQRSACSDYAAAGAQVAASSSCKLKSSTAGSSSEFVNVNKESIREEDTRVVAARRSRGEGMVDSWLCSSSSSDHR